MKVYWANSIFSEADREFNTKCVAELRSRGFQVLNPQEKPFNHPEGAADALSIFHTDTQMIRECDVFVACIDQEAIDAGVACELGIAWSWTKQVFALYTDFRQFRSGEYRMYKNPYVVGCIQDRGRIAKSLTGLVAQLENIRTDASA
jgi:nucleoside 2-deoxyribosyltransferase